MVKRWIFPPDEASRVGRLADALRLSPVTARLLVNRGLAEPTAAQSFLQPTLNDLTDPSDDPATREAAAFLLEAVREGRHVTIYGDFDADGICATAVLMRALHFLTARADTYIPHRIEDGYGLSEEAVRELAEGGTEVLVTVDCGISAAPQVALARELGMKVIVTDHHRPRDGIPEADHLLNPKLKGSRLGYEFLAGVGVAFKLVWAMGQQLSGSERVSDEFKDLLMEALALVAIGTVADVAPLVDENRVLVHFGLQTIAAADRPGLRALLETARVNPEYISSDDIAFRVAPLLNAAGRMGDAGGAVELLITHDPARAAELADHLRAENRRRRNVQSSTCREALAMVEEDPSLCDGRCIVLHNPDWHQGIVGLVASRLAERYWRPAFVLTGEGGVATGSARSVGGFPLYTAIERCADLLERFGGHEAAAGLSLAVGKVAEFARRINAVAAELASEEMPEPELRVDGEFDLFMLSLDLMRELNRLGPFGKGNPAPLFAASGLRVVGNPQTVGKDGRHLSFMVRQGRTTMRTFAAGKADWLEQMRERRGESLSLAYEPSINRWGGQARVELRAEDLRWDAEPAA